MTAPEPAPDERLVSWKAIAAFLDRDVVTVRRWERSLGLPVHRVPGARGHSVFAYKSEIEAWLRRSEPAAAVSAPAPPRARLRTGALLAAALLAVLGGLWLSWPARRPAGPLHFDVSAAGVVAVDARGATRWEHRFPAEFTHHLPVVSDPLRVVAGDPAEVFVAISDRERVTTRVAEGGTLMAFDEDGRQQGAFSFDDVVTIGGARYGPPWAVTAFAVDDAAGRRQVAVASHHMIWSPSVVTVLDDRWRRQGTFVHAGWIEAVHWLAADRLLVGGFSQSHDGGMVALLDAGRLRGQGPEPVESAYYCESCDTTPPLRMVVMPRTEINRVTASRFNRAIVQVTPDRIVVRTIEAQPATADTADAIYEFTPDLELVRASFSDRYWDLHRALEVEGKLTHGREACPDRQGPAPAEIWTPERGWTRAAR